MATKKATVWVQKREGYKSYYLRYKDPVTKRERWKSARTTKIREAERAAARLEDEIASGQRAVQDDCPFQLFRIAFVDGHLPGLAKGTNERYAATFNKIEKYINPLTVAQIDSKSIIRLVNSIRKEGSREATVKSYLAHISKILNWAVDYGYIAERPKLPRAKRARKSSSTTPMKGRPITLEEFERMLLAVPEVIPAMHCEEWQFALKGLWLSGLRLSESYFLSWEEGSGIWIDTSGRKPVYRIPAESEKGNKDRILPIVSEYWEHLETIPRDKRHGYVYDLSLPVMRDGRDRPSLWTYGYKIRMIGQASGVKVSETKHASAHDLRRSFANRWAVMVKTAVLKELMRHDDIKTTERYYVSLEAETVSDQIWNIRTTELGNGLAAPVT